MPGESNNVILKKFLCPECKQGVHLDSDNFTVTVNPDNTWDADPGVWCPYDECGAEFFITNSQVQYIK